MPETVLKLSPRQVETFAPVLQRHDEAMTVVTAARAQIARMVAVLYDGPAEEVYLDTKSMEIRRKEGDG